MEPKISLVVAHSKNLVIGKAGGLPWHLPDDLKRFKALTTGHTIIMGRKTHASIGRALPNRTNIVITRDRAFEAPGCVVVSSLPEALAEAKKVELQEIFIIGGGQIYAEALPIASRLYVTRVEAIIEGDTFFPEYQALFPTVVTEEQATVGEYAVTYLILEK